MHRLLALIASTVVCLSLASGFYILTANIRPSSVHDPQLSCGGVVGSLRDKPNYGGELPYPNNWIDLCEEAARDRLDWIAVAAIAGPLGLLYLAGAAVASARRGKAGSNTTGTPLG